jgi:hypothetical protein
MTLQIKKPLNNLENPIYPDIKSRNGLRFVWSKKNWKATEEAVRELEDDTQRYEHAVLFQSRDYANQIYGVHSGRTQVVNKSFRPPLLTFEDNIALSRQPRKYVVPRINPGTGENLVYNTQIAQQDEIGGYITDRVKKGEIRPTFFAPIEFAPTQITPTFQITKSNGVVLERKTPKISLNAGTLYPTTCGTMETPVFLEDNRPKASLILNRTSNLNFDNVNSFDISPKKIQSRQVVSFEGFKNSPFEASMSNSVRHSMKDKLTVRDSIADIGVRPKLTFIQNNNSLKAIKSR